MPLISLSFLRCLWERLSTADLLVLTSLDPAAFYFENISDLFHKTSYLNEEVNCTEPLPSVSLPRNFLEA
jgi:hypothetical protein